MRPRRTPSSNKVYRLQDGNEDSDLWVECLELDDGEQAIRSVWALDDAERQAIADGANIELLVWGEGHPPVSVGVAFDALLGVNRP